MNLKRRRTRVSMLALALAAITPPATALTADHGSQIVMLELRGESLSHTLIGTDPVRKLAVYLHKLNEFGIPHEAEEYNGVWGTGN
jgi:hypothetical protein